MLHLPLALAAVFLAIALAACGGGDDASAPAGTTAPSRQSTPALPAYAAAGPESRLGEGLASPDELGELPPGDDLALVARRLRPPLARGFAVIDAFGAPRDNGMVHAGVDLGGPAGSAVISPCAGKVTESAVDDDHGEYVALDCGGEWTALVAYLSNRQVAAGAAAGVGARIGTIDSALQYVHFELRFRGQLVDPSFLLAEATPTATPVVVAGNPRATATPAAASTIPSPSPTDTATPASPTVVPPPGATPTLTPTSTAAATPVPPTARPTRQPPPPTNTPVTPPPIR